MTDYKYSLLLEGICFAVRRDNSRNRLPENRSCMLAISTSLKSRFDPKQSLPVPRAHLQHSHTRISSRSNDEKTDRINFPTIFFGKIHLGSSESRVVVWEFLMSCGFPFCRWKSARSFLLRTFDVLYTSECLLLFGFTTDVTDLIISFFCERTFNAPRVCVTANFSTFFLFSNSRGRLPDS